MRNQEIQINSKRESRLSFTCIVLCGVLALVLGLAPKIPSSITHLLRPAFIALCMINMNYSRYYKLGSLKYHIVNLVYYTIILFAFPMNKSVITGYISIALFIVFLIFAASRQWSSKEIALVILAVICACDLNSIITLADNPGILHSSGSAHMNFLGATANRNTLAFELVPGSLCGMFAFLYDKYKSSNIKRGFYLIS